MPRNESLRSSALMLAAAGGIEFGLQMAIPILLARTLDELAFAQYRLLWLLAGTVLAVAPMFMPQSLFYFLSRVRARHKGLYVGNVLIFLAAAGLLSGLVVSGFNPWLQDAARTLFDDTAGLSAWFLASWVVASILDVLPTADGRARWQAGAIIALAMLRTGLLAAAALLSGDIMWVAAAMLLVAVVKLLLVGGYIRSFIARGSTTWDLAVLRRQFMYAFPFAVGNTLFLLRVQADQWVVVSMLPTAMYATFSVAAAILPISTLIRQPVNNALLPRLNRAFANHELGQAAHLIALSNGATALLLILVAGGLFTCAPELVELMYTSRYRDAAPVMQVYLIGMMIGGIAVGHTLPALGHGRFAAINSGCCLLLSVLLCVVGVSWFGMRGAAGATMLTLALSEVWSLRVISRTLRTSMHKLIHWHALLPALIGMAGALATVGLLSMDWDLPLWQAVVAKSALYAAAFVPMFLLAGGWQALSELAGFREKPEVAEGGAHETA